jgi:hypothetical protein
MIGKGLQVASVGTIVAGRHPSLGKTVLVKLAKPDEFGSYASENLQGFFLNWDQCGERIGWLMNDWQRGLVDDEEYAKGTLKKFGWSSDLPAAPRQNGLLAALGVFSELRIDKVLRMLQDYWRASSPARVDDSMVVGDDLEWFRLNCLSPNSLFQKERSKLRHILMADAMRASESRPELARILTSGHLTVYVDNFYVVRPSAQTMLA